MPSPISFETIAGLSPVALFVIALWAFFTGRIRREGEVKDVLASGESRLAEMRADRDGWKDIANESLEKVDRQTDVVEKLTAMVEMLAGKSRT
jgi:hypothetical protein